MIIVEFIVGVLLVVVGVIVIFTFPDRSGGQIKWQGTDISSKWAGLPVIFLGLVCIFDISMTHKPSINLFPPKPPIDFDKCFGSVTKDTIVVLEDGSHNNGLIGSD